MFLAQMSIHEIVRAAEIDRLRLAIAQLQRDGSASVQLNLRESLALNSLRPIDIAAQARSDDEALLMVKTLADAGAQIDAVAFDHALHQNNNKTAAYMLANNAALRPTLGTARYQQLVARGLVQPATRQVVVVHHTPQASSFTPHAAVHRGGGASGGHSRVVVHHGRGRGHPSAAVVVRPTPKPGATSVVHTHKKGGGRGGRYGH